LKPIDENERNNNMKTTESNRPAYTKKIGAVRVAVWANQKDDRTFYNISVNRIFRDGDVFKESSSLNGLADIACLREALSHVATWLSRAEDAAADSEA
jgi:hypothetical protein